MVARPPISSSACTGEVVCSRFLRAHGSAWLERIPDKDEVPGSNPGGPTGTPAAFLGSYSVTPGNAGTPAAFHSTHTIPASFKPCRARIQLPVDACIPDPRVGSNDETGTMTDLWFKSLGSNPGGWERLRRSLVESSGFHGNGNAYGVPTDTYYPHRGSKMNGGTTTWR